MTIVEGSWDLVHYAVLCMMGYDVISYHMVWLDMTLGQVISNEIVNCICLYIYIAMQPKDFLFSQ